MLFDRDLLAAWIMAGIGRLRGKDPERGDVCDGPGGHIAINASAGRIESEDVGSCEIRSPYVFGASEAEQPRSEAAPFSR